MRNIGYIVYNYVDDFMSIDCIKQAWASYNTLANLLRDLGVNEALDKSVAPTHIIEFLGILFDLLRMLIFVPADKLEEIIYLLKTWRQYRKCTKKQLESLAGKLQFIAIVVRPGRVFITRIYNAIARMQDGIQYTIPQQVLLDVAWWDKYIEHFNGCSMMWLDDTNTIKQDFATDASLNWTRRDI